MKRASETPEFRWIGVPKDITDAIDEYQQARKDLGAAFKARPEIMELAVRNGLDWLITETAKLQTMVKELQNT